MIKTINKFKNWNNQSISLDITLLVFRVVLSVQLIIVHGIKKIGIGTKIAEVVPNPYHLPETINQLIGILSYLLLPLFIIIGWNTRWASVPIVAVALSGYFLVYWDDPLFISDVSFMYSLSFLLIICLGPGKYSFDKILK